MAVYVNDAIWRRLSAYYNVDATQAQVGDLYKRWLDDNGLNWGTAGDFFQSQFPGTTRGDAEWLYWTGGFGDNLVLLLDAALEPQTGSPQWALNHAEFDVVNARYGGTGRQELRGVNHGLLLPGTAIAGNYTSVPDEAALDIADNLDVRVRFRANSIASGAEQYLVGKYDTAGNQRSWAVSLNSTGNVSLRVSGNGTLVSSGTTVGLWPLGSSTTGWLRFTVQANFGGQLVFNVYYARDEIDEPSEWVFWERIIPGGSIASIHSGTAPVEFGTVALGSVAGVTGSIYRTQIRDGIDGTVVLDVDFTKPAQLSSSFTATTGQTVTVAPTGTDSADPTLLQHTGENYLYLPGLSGNYASTPDAAALDITGDIDIRCRVSLSEFSTAQALVSKAQTSAGGYELAVSGGFMRFIWATGTTTITRFSVNTLTAAGLTAGETYWLRATLDVDNGAGGAQVSFFWAPDSVTEPTSWTAFTQPAAEGTTTVIGNATQQLGIGAYFNGGATPLAGKFFRAIVRNGIGGTVVFDADFTTSITSGAQTSFTESSSNAATVTINRSSTGRKSVAVTRPVWLFGTDDYLSVPDSGLLDYNLSESFTVIALARKWGNGYTSTAGFYAGKQGDPASSVGWRMGYDATTEVFGMRAGAATTATIARSGTSSIDMVASVRDVATDTVTMYVNGVAGTVFTDNVTGTAGNALSLDIGRLNVPATPLYADMELFAFAVVNRALTAAELVNIQQYFS